MEPGASDVKSVEHLQLLIAELERYDCGIGNDRLEAVLSYGEAAIPYLEEILAQRLAGSAHINLGAPPKDTEWFTVVHALFLLAHLHASRSLDLVLKFLAQRQELLDYWLQDLVNEELWEVPFLLGRDQTEKLASFVRSRENNEFSRLAVCTSLVQLALNFPVTASRIRPVFRDVLGNRDETSDFVGLVASELLDLLDPKLKPVILTALSAHDVWPGLLSVADVEHRYERKHKRVLQPVEITARYHEFRQYTYFRRSSSDDSRKEEIRRVLDRSPGLA